MLSSYFTEPMFCQHQLLWLFYALHCKPNWSNLDPGPFIFYEYSSFKRTVFQSQHRNENLKTLEVCLSKGQIIGPMSTKIIASFYFRFEFWRGKINNLKNVNFPFDNTWILISPESRSKDLRYDLHTHKIKEVLILTFRLHL